PFAAGTDDHELQAVPPVDRVRRRDDAVERVIHLEAERVRGVAEAPALADARCDELRRLAETLRPDARGLRERTDRCRNAPPAATLAGPPPPTTSSKLLCHRPRIS